ncbi:hypothetical protein EMIT0P100_70221 [Pseudomonas sp. IT-P100]
MSSRTFTANLCKKKRLSKNDKYSHSHSTVLFPFNHPTPPAIATGSSRHRRLYPPF